MSRFKIKFFLVIFILSLLFLSSMSYGSGTSPGSVEIKVSPDMHATPPHGMLGGACEYVDIPGVATIVSLKEADPAQYNCKNAVEVLFNFIPSDTRAAGRYHFPDWQDNLQRLTVGSGMNPSRAWVNRKGIIKGKTYPCIRSEIFKGTCTPVIFKFPELNLPGRDENCF